MLLSHLLRDFPTVLWDPWNSGQHTHMAVGKFVHRYNMLNKGMKGGLVFLQESWGAQHLIKLH